MNRQAKSLDSRFAPMLWIGLLLATSFTAICPAADRHPDGPRLPGTALLEIEGDISDQMIAGVDRFLLREIQESSTIRNQYWKRDYSSAEAYTASVEPNRREFARIIGLRDPRLPVTDIEYVSSPSQPALVARTGQYDVLAIRWPVFAGVNGEGLLLVPTTKPPRASVVVIPDCEHSPEMLVGLSVGVPVENQIARRLCESGCRVIVPTLINRGHDLSVIAGGKRKSTVTHREILYRPAYQMGRHLIGYEVNKVLAAVDWLSQSSASSSTSNDLHPSRIGVIGYGEGGLVALYASAVDTRIHVTGVSGYFQPRQEIWREPIDRNVFGLLKQFGDAEIATLIAPRPLVIEACSSPKVVIPAGGQSAPAEIETSSLKDVTAEVERARKLVERLGSHWIDLVSGVDGNSPFGSPQFLELILRRLNEIPLVTNAAVPVELRKDFDPLHRHARQFRELSDFSQALVEDSPRVRAEYTAAIDRSSGIAKFLESVVPYRNHFRQQIIGAFDRPLSTAAPRSRLAYDTVSYSGYEVVLDVFPDVILYGILLVPKSLAKDERRPVVVCQHGLEGRAQHTVEGDFTSYRGFAARLAERGFVTFAPQHLYRSGDRFRTLQRKANPLGHSLFSIMTAQHQRLLAWLGQLDFVDRERIAFYGISYGGKSAMRIPSVLDGYCLSICSSDFSNWIWRTVSNRFESGYLAHAEYEIFEFDLGNTFNYGEMTALICPRPFMVERFHHHGLVADSDAAEYGRVQLLYENLGLSDQTRMSYFGAFNSNEPYTERETFQFLHDKLKWQHDSPPHK